MYVHNKKGEHSESTHYSLLTLKLKRNFKDFKIAAGILFFLFLLLFSLPASAHASQTTVAIEKPSYSEYLPPPYTGYYIIYTPISGQNGKYLAWPIYVSGTATNDLSILYETEIRAFTGTDQNSGTYTGTWATYTVSGMYGGDSKYSLTTNDYVEFSLTVAEGQTVALLPVKVTNAGYAYVTIDGQASLANLLPDDGSGNRYIDLYGSTTPNLYKNKRYAVPVANGLSTGTHTIRVTVSGQKNPSSSGTRVYIDGMAVYNTSGTSTDTIDNDFIITSKTQLTASGDWEYAYYLKKDGVGTYYGTTTHGNDALSSFTISLDGVERTLSNFDKYTGTNLNIAEVSTIGDGTYPNIASVNRGYAFSSSGLDFTNTTTWNNPLPVIIAYWSMFPILDGPSTSTVGRFGGTNTSYTLTTNDDSLLGNLNTTKAYEYNSSNQRLYSLEITGLDSYVNNDQKMNIWDKAAPSYNKIYYYRQASATLANPYTPSAGEVWSSTNKYRYFYDSSAPTGVTLSSPDNGSRASDTTPSLSWSAGIDAESEIDHYVVTLDGSDNTIAAGTTNLTTSTLSAGSHTWLVKAYDYLNNLSTTDSRSFIVDLTLTSNPTLTSPTGYTRDNTKPTLSFKKSSDLNSIVSTYSVTLDSGKNKSYSTSRIPSSGNGSASYVWKDDNDVKIEFLNENDSDSTNDEIKVYFKGLNSNELTEGKHSWSVTVYDSASNSTSHSTDFYLDKTSPSISELAVADVSTVSSGVSYNLNITNRMPSFSGLATDIYQGSTVTNNNGTKDTFDKISSGPKTITLAMKRLDGKEYKDYLTKEYSLSDITNLTDDKKTSRFYITTPFPLIDGKYKVQLSLKDDAGNTYEQPDFYLTLNSDQTNIAQQLIGKNLKTKIIEQKTTPAETEEEKQEAQENGYSVKIKVIDKEKNPVKGAKVTIHSKVQETTTDENGVARFSNVEPGDHRVFIAYDNYEGEQKLSLTGDVKEFSLTIQVEEASSFSTNLERIVLGVLGITIFSLVLFVYKSKKTRK